MPLVDCARTTPTQRWLGFAMLLLGTFMGMLDIFIVNVAGPSIQSDLDADFGDLQRIVAAYDIACAAALVLGGRLGDIWGHRRVFLIGTALFAITSLACALAPDAPVLILARSVQGLAAAVMLPQVLSITQQLFSGVQRTRAFGWYSASIGVAAIAGQVIGGALLAWNPAGLAWRSVFVVNLPISVVAFAGVAIFVRQQRTVLRRRLDLVGTMLLALALVALLFALSGGPAVGFLLSALAFLAFWWHERRLSRHGDGALISVSLFGLRSFVGGLAAAFVFYAASAGFVFVLANYLQRSLALTPLAAGMIFAPMAVASMAGSLLSGRITTLVGDRAVVAAAAVAAAGLGLVAVAGGPPLLLLPGLIVYGLAGGLIAAAVVALPLTDIRPDDVGSGSGTLLTVTQAANAIGLSAAGALFLAAQTTRTAATAFALTLGVLAVGFVALVPIFRLLARTRG